MRMGDLLFPRSCGSLESFGQPEGQSFDGEECDDATETPSALISRLGMRSSLALHWWRSCNWSRA